MTAIKLVSGSILPMTANRSRTDNRFAVPISFVAGFLIGVPITYCLLFLLPHEGDFYNDVTARPNSSGGLFSTFGSRNPKNFSQLGGATHLPILAAPFIASSLLGSRPAKSDEMGRQQTRNDATHRQNLSTSFLPNFEEVDLLDRQQTRGAATRRPNLSKGASAGSPVMSSLFIRPKKRTRWAAFGEESALEDAVDGVFWTDLSERQVPRGYGDHDVRLWKRLLNTTSVLAVEEGCGRMQNRMVTLVEGRKACCRYRHNDDQIQGEIFSFHLGRLLGLRNLPPSALALADARGRRWAPAAAQITLARWSPERPVVLTQFVEGLQPAFVPRHFRQAGRRRLHPVPEDLSHLGPDEVGELVQWSDLVLFDYLTGNLDRVVNNLFNERWNADMMKQPTHNLARTPQGLLLFLDNESGLLHGYRLLDKYEHFHRALLDGLCIFRRDTVQSLDRLHRGNVGSLLRQAFEEGDPGMADWLPFLPERSLRTLRERIAHVHQHVRTCQSRFGPKSVVLEAPDTV